VKFKIRIPECKPKFEGFWNKHPQVEYLWNSQGRAHKVSKSVTGAQITLEKNGFHHLLVF